MAFHPGSIHYAMRAKRIDNGLTVHWVAIDKPDVSGAQSGIAIANLTDIIITQVFNR